MEINENQEFASFLAHDLRSPLAQIHSLITIMEMNPDPEFIKETGEKIKQLIELQLINYNDLLYYYKYDNSNPEPIELKAYSLNNLLNEIVEKWESIYPEYKNKIILDLNDSIQINCKKDLFNYILLTLLQRVFPYLNPSHVLLIQNQTSAQAKDLIITFDSDKFNWDELIKKFRKSDRDGLVKNLGLDLFQSIELGKLMGMKIHYQNNNSENKIYLSFE